MNIFLKSRRLLWLPVLFAVSILLTSCVSPRQDVTPHSIAQDVLNRSTFSKMVEITPDQLRTHLSIPSSALEDYCFYISTAEGNADEIGIFKASSQESVTNLKTAVSEHLMQLESRFSNLDQSESDKISKCIFTEHQQWVFLIISSNPEKAKEVLTGYFSNMVFKG
ncbi:MAG: DUF4358 domain-containing protein [Clostridiales bacterium]|nr:DUF4358 domain-containing protein [Clostridiales bacterium]